MLKLVAGFLGYTSLAVLLTVKAQADVLTFKDWKSNQVIAAKKQLSRSKVDKVPSSRIRGVVRVSNMARDELRSIAVKKSESKQSKLRMLAARELTIQDYFEIYLNNEPDREKAIQEVAGKLTTEEMTQLLLSYGQALK